MKDILQSIMGLTDNEIKVYQALLKLKKGTKTPIVRGAKILSSKVYEVLDRLIEKGLVTYFIENKVKTYVPVHPSNISEVFDEKIQEIEKQKKDFSEELNKWYFQKDMFSTDVQLFKGWKGLTSAFNIMLNDLESNDTHYVLGMNGGENIEKSWKIFPKIAKKFEDKGIKKKVILREETKKVSEEYFLKFGRKNWKTKYYSTFGPMEIGISNNYVMISLLEEEPIIILINNKRIRDSYLHNFESIWKISK